MSGRLAEACALVEKVEAQASKPHPADRRVEVHGAAGLPQRHARAAKARPRSLSSAMVSTRPW